MSDWRAANKMAQRQLHVGGCTGCEHKLIKMCNCWVFCSCRNESRHMKLKPAPPMSEQTHTTSHGLPPLLSIKDCSSRFK